MNRLLTIMKTRSIQKIIATQKVDMGGFIVDQALPMGSIDMIDPFLLIHHASKEYSAGSNEKDLGVGPHPHRGFSPVTFVFEGEVHHRDSRGNSSVVQASGTQWMHSGMGIVHSERPSKRLATQGGTMEIIQFWVNVPVKYKMVQPEYTPLTAKETPTKLLKDNKSNIQLIAGEFDGLVGPVKTYSPLLIMRLNLMKNAVAEITIPEEFNSLVYQLDGALEFNNTTEGVSKQLTRFRNDGDGIVVKALKDTRAILLAGTPISEKVVSHGPFVMNNESQILEAMRDYQMGKMGMLVEDL
jgi:redox-sensitive bicupin YhaK (pirin superfamily)